MIIGRTDNNLYVFFASLLPAISDQVWKDLNECQGKIINVIILLEGNIEFFNELLRILNLLNVNRAWIVGNFGQPRAFRNVLFTERHHEENAIGMEIKQIPDSVLWEIVVIVDTRNGILLSMKFPLDYL